MADMFDITDEDNNRLDYIGMMVRRGPTPPPEDFINVGAGMSISATINLGDNYEFVTGGKYTVRLNMPGYSDLISTENVQLAIQLDSAPIRQQIKGPQGFTNCNANQISQVNSAISGSLSSSARAYNCLYGETCEALSTQWFGTYSASNRNYATSCFNAVYNRLNNYEFNGYCNPAGCGNNVFGYVYPTDTTFTVYMCALFWSIPAERVNTIVHEMSHFRTLGGTNDYAYGRSNCLALARQSPNQATRNADNICYFAEDA